MMFEIEVPNLLKVKGKVVPVLYPRTTPLRRIEGVEV
jgi:hypothetical protein